MSSDYNPHPVAIAPAASSSTAATGDYGAPRSSAAATGSDSVKITGESVAPSIGHDITDAAALASVLEAKGTLP